MSQAIRIYIAGPMTGLPEFNYPAFRLAADKLRASGFRVTSPNELHVGTDQSWDFYMRSAIKALVDCDVIFMLRNWELSRGALIEYDLAKKLGFGVIYEADFFPFPIPTGLPE